MKNNIIFKIGKWKVYKNGDISYENWYHITNDILLSENWINHLSLKNWVNIDEFKQCYEIALKIVKP